MVDGQAGRILFFRLEKGEDLSAAIKNRAEASGIRTGVFIMIGTVDKTVIGYYREGKYEHVRFNSPMEIASCMGNIVVNERGETAVHGHIVVSNERAEAFGGHVMRDTFVGATAELMILEVLGLNVQRAFDEKTGLNLLRLG